MTTAGAVYDAVDRAAPFSETLDFDNTGLLAGNREDPVSRVLTALDITPSVVRKAAELGAQLILSHHPVIFHPLRRLERGSVPWLLAQTGIGALCCHTNLDVCPTAGVNIALAKKLGLQNVRGIVPSGGGFLCYEGSLSRPMGPEEFAAHVKTCLQAGGVRLAAGKKPVRLAALCSGSGGEFLSSAISSGADAFVTGELRHHQALAALEAGITVVEAGHYETERCFGDLLIPLLREQLPDVEFLSSRTERPPMKNI